MKQRTIEQCAQAIAVLMQVADSRQHFIYEDFFRKTGVPAQGQVWLLRMVRRWCDANDLPRLNVLVININTRQPGAGCQDDWQSEQRRVYEYDWSEVKWPTVDDLVELWVEDRKTG